MTQDRTPGGTRIPATWRKTAIMLAVWVAAAVTLGMPGRQESSASAEVRPAPAPKIVHWA